MTTDIVLKPAKPYTGTAQHQAVRAALKPFIESRLVTTDRLGTYTPKLTIDARGGGYFKDLRTDMAQVRIQAARYGSQERDVIAEAKAAFETITAALEAAGWTVKRHPDSNSADVHGPGLDEWVKATKKLRAERAAHNDKVLAERLVELEAARAILKAYGIPEHKADNYRGYVKVEISLDDLRKLTETKRDVPAWTAAVTEPYETDDLSVQP